MLKVVQEIVNRGQQHGKAGNLTGAEEAFREANAKAIDQFGVESPVRIEWHYCRLFVSVTSIACRSARLSERAVFRFQSDAVSSPTACCYAVLFGRLTCVCVYVPCVCTYHVWVVIELEHITKL